MSATDAGNNGEAKDQVTDQDRQAAVAPVAGQIAGVDKQVTDQRKADYIVKKGDTFSTITAKVSELAEPDFEKFFIFIYGELVEFKRHRELFFSGLRDGKWKLLSRLRRSLIVLGMVALLGAALAAAAPLIVPDNSAWSGLDKWALLLAVAAYAVMGAIALYERGSDLSQSYFRQLEASISIRNSWSKLQFSLLKEYPALLAAADKGDLTREDMRDRRGFLQRDRQDCHR